MVATTAAEIEGLRRSGRATAQLLRDLVLRARPGVTTGDLNAYACAYIVRLGAEPVFHTEAGFPGCINTSVNEVALHGVPGERLLREGDLLSLDAGMLLDGYVGDSTVTVPIGRVDPRHRRLLRVTRETMQAGIRAVVAGKRIGDIGHVMQRYAEARGFRLLRDFYGHGVGHRMHEEPSVPFVGRPGTGPVMPDGLVITIEPILVERSARWRLDPDGWSVRTADGGYAAQFEHTVLVTPRGGMILSQA